VADSSLLYGIIGALGIVVVGAGVYVAKEHGAVDPATPTAAVTAPDAVPAPAPSPAPAPPPVSAGPTAAQAEQLRQLVLDVRHAITHGDFRSADRLLDQAEKMDARDRGVQQARAELNAAARPGRR